MNDIVVANFGDFVEDVIITRNLSPQNPVISRESGDDISIGNICVVISNKLYLADNENITHMNKNKFVSLTDGVIGDTITAQTTGRVDLPGFTLTVDTPLFLSTQGSLTEVVPTTGFVQQIGIALTPDVLDMSNSTAIKL